MLVGPGERGSSSWASFASADASATCPTFNRCSERGLPGDGRHRLAGCKHTNLPVMCFTFATLVVVISRATTPWGVHIPSRYVLTAPSFLPPDVDVDKLTRLLCTNRAIRTRGAVAVSGVTPILFSVIAAPDRETTPFRREAIGSVAPRSPLDNHAVHRRISYIVSTRHRLLSCDIRRSPTCSQFAALSSGGGCAGLQSSRRNRWFSHTRLSIP